MIVRLLLRCALLSAIIATAFGGTVSPQLAAMDPNQTVQIIVQYTSSAGGLLSPVCGLLSFIELLPGGELCSTSVLSALALAPNPAVTHISVKNTLQRA